MHQLLLLTVLSLVAATHQLDPVYDQLPIYKEQTKGPIGPLTTTSGFAIEKKYTESTLNRNLNTNPFFMDRLTSFVRENIPERIVHTKAAGAFGYFKTTHNISDVCVADFLNEIGKETPIACRMSVGVTEKGGPDTTATPMGFACRFYTQEGNLDLLGLNFPLFTLKDPLLFPSFIHAYKKNPATNMADPNMLWDYIALHPESIYMTLMLYGDRGIPLSYRHMPGYPIHTFQVFNATGHTKFVRFQWIPVAGMKYMNATAAAKAAASDLDYYSADLYRSIANGEYPKWKLKVQILTEEDVEKATYDVFDTSNSLSEEEFPPVEVGEMVLNKNPTNYFAQVEQLALNPANLVRGIPGCPDKAFEARLMFYRQAHCHRLGVNYNYIPVNCPLNKDKRYTYNQNGAPQVKDNADGAPNYHPNSFNGPEAYYDEFEPTLKAIHQAEPNNFEQAKQHYLTKMSSGERTRYVQTISATLCAAIKETQERVVKAYAKIHSELSDMVAEALKKC